MFFPVQKYKSQYKNKSCSTKFKKKMERKQQQQQYNNVYPSTEIYILVQK